MTGLHFTVSGSGGPPISQTMGAPLEINSAPGHTGSAEIRLAAAGPAGNAAGAIADDMSAEPSRFPDLTQRDPVIVTDPDGVETEAEYVGETPNGIKLMVGDQVFDYTDDMLAAGTTIAPRFRGEKRR